jgi:iron complex transport system ATP-binding protein
VKLVIDGVEVYYNSIPALRGASFEAQGGEVVAVIGPNGAGKTTLLRAIASIVKPLRGAIYIDGRLVNSVPPKERGKLIALVEPSISRSIPSSVLEFLLTARYPYSKLYSFTPSKRDLEVIDIIAKKLNITHLLNRRLDELSSGEFQRVLIARALIQEPRVLLLDEPTAFLDIKYRLEVMELVRYVTKEQRIISITAIHDVYLASLYADKVVLLSNGVIVAAGKPEDVFREELIENVYGVKVQILNIGDRRIVIPIQLLNNGQPT